VPVPAGLPGGHPAAAARAAAVAAVAAAGAVVEEDAEVVAVDDMMSSKKTWIDALPRLGVGLGFRRQLALEIVAHAAEIDFLEIISEHYLNPTDFEARELRELAGRFQLIPHGLSLSPGTAEPVRRDYARSIDRLVDQVHAPWWSDHLAMTRAGRIDIGHLAPITLSEEMLGIVCDNIVKARSEVAAPFIIENIAYTLRMPGAEMSEAEFLRRVVERTDSGLLLDLMNLHANSRNHGYDPYEFLTEIPLERVVQIHIIGGHYHHGVLIDSHSHRTPDEVWRLLEFVARRAVIKAVLIEWDEQFPDFKVILEELARAREVLARKEEAVYAGA
jgi:uncharacterized protein (UPF0276 family)